MRNEGEWSFMIFLSHAVAGSTLEADKAFYIQRALLFQKSASNTKNH
jgi:hypothetical protein